MELSLSVACSASCHLISQLIEPQSFASFRGLVCHVRCMGGSAVDWNREILLSDVKGSDVALRVT